MDDDLTGYEYLRALATERPDWDAEAIAAAALRRLKVGSHVTRILLPVVTDGARQLLRNDVRVIERAAFPRSARRELGEIVQSGLERKRLLDATFIVNDGRAPVRWGEATIEDHQARIDMLAKMRNGIDDTISRHQEAIALIQANGVRCLNDVASDAA